MIVGHFGQSLGVEVILTPVQKRELILKARVYRVFAFIFVIAAVVTFIYLYLHNVEGRVFEILKDKPGILVILVLPFVPAAALTFLAKRLEKKFIQVMKSDRGIKDNS